MQKVLVVALVIGSLVGCSSPKVKAAEPVLHSPDYRELPPYVPFTPKPVGALPTLAQIKADVFAWCYTNTLDVDKAKVEYEGQEGKPPTVRNASPGIYKGGFTVDYGSQFVYSKETQPAHEVRVWINGGQGFKLHLFHYLDGQLVHVE